LRGLLNTVDLAAEEISAFDQGRLSAAYCEAKAWPDEPESESDPPDRLHPDQAGYGAENGNGTPDSGIVRFDQEDDEDQDADGDETDPSAEDKEKLTQPMVKLTKRAFICEEDVRAEEGEIDPNDLVVWDEGESKDVAAVGCEEIMSGAKVAPGTRVYWVFTVVNIGLFGAISAPEGAAFTVEDYVNSSGDPESCVLNWKLTEADTPAGTPRFKVHKIYGDDLGKPIWPTQGRVCAYSGVL
jgi:hypothetical protein